MVSDTTYIDDMVHSIREAVQTPIPDEMQSVIDGFCEANNREVDHLTASILAVLLHWLHEASRRVDERAATQVAMRTAHAAVALFCKQVKLRHGEDLVPGRYALAAYHTAHWVASIDSKPADLSKADELFEALRTPIEKERDALQATLYDIVSMIIECADAPKGSDSLPRMILERIDRTLGTRREAHD